MNGVWYTYLLECQKGLYCGSTTDVARREHEHNHDKKKGAKAVRRLGLPAKMVYCELHDSMSAAMKREYAIKQLTRKQKLDLVKSSENKIMEVIG